MNLLEIVNDVELNELVLRAYRSASENRSEPVHINAMREHLEEELFESLRYDIEEFYERYGRDLNLESFAEISETMISESGVSVPKMTTEDVAFILTEANICFFAENGKLENDPQIKSYGHNQK